MHVNSFLKRLVLYLVVFSAAFLLTYSLCDKHPAPEPAKVTPIRTKSMVDQMIEATVSLIVTEPGGKSYGSGVIIRPDGVIATAKHVIVDANQVEIMLYDGCTCKALSWAISIDSDVALLYTGLHFPVWVPVSPDDPVVGQEVYLCSSPLGMEYQNLLSYGIVGKYPAYILELTTHPILVHDAFQTFGSSGGPLFDTSGRVIGLVLGMDARWPGLNFATPSYEIHKLLDLVN